MKIHSRRRKAVLLPLAVIAIAGGSFPAAAYVGPGAGLTVLGALWGLILAIVMSIGFVILWPIRRFMRGRKRDHVRRDGETVDHLKAESEMLANPSDRRGER